LRRLPHQADGQEPGQVQQYYVEDSHPAIIEPGEECAARYEPLEQRFDAVNAEFTALESQRMERRAKGDRVRQVMAALRDRAGLLAEFDEQLWFSLVDHVRVSAQGLEVIWRGCVEAAA
jgi:hypothetical protein